MISKKHFIVNVALILFPWVTVLFLGWRNIKRYSVAGFFIVIFEIINHLIGKKLNWWKFFEKPRNFLKDELPFSIGPYMPLSMWILKYSYGNFGKFLFLNVVADGVFAYIGMDLLKKLKIVKLHKLSRTQFFIYIHYKAYLLYAVQYWFEKTFRR